MGEPSFVLVKATTLSTRLVYLLSLLRIRQRVVPIPFGPSGAPGEPRAAFSSASFNQDGPFPPPPQAWNFNLIPDSHLQLRSVLPTCCCVLLTFTRCRAPPALPSHFCQDGPSRAPSRPGVWLHRLLPPPPRVRQAGVDLQVTVPSDTPHTHDPHTQDPHTQNPHHTP